MIDKELRDIYNITARFVGAMFLAMFFADITRYCGGEVAIGAIAGAITGWRLCSK